MFHPSDIWLPESKEINPSPGKLFLGVQVWGMLKDKTNQLNISYFGHINVSKTKVTILVCECLFSNPITAFNWKFNIFCSEFYSP